MNFWEQIKRRNVFKVGAAYLTVAWLLTQVASNLEDALNLNPAFDTVVVRLLILGFPIALLLSWVFELTPEGIKRTQKDVTTEEWSRPTGRVLNFVIIGALSLAVVFLVVDKYVLEESTPIREQAGVTSNKIAILPFETLGDDEGAAGVAEGIYVDLLSELSKLDGIELVGRPTMQRYEDSPLTYPEISAETGARYVMKLAVTYDGVGILVNFELFEVEGLTENFLVAGSFPGDFSADGLLTVRASLARNIAEQVAAELSPAEESRLTDDLDALTFYLRALPYIDDGTEENAENCLDLISRAVALDSGFKEAWYEKGVCHDIRGAFYADIAKDEQQLALNALEQALAIDNQYADALSYLPSVFASAGDWRAAAVAYRKALDSGVQPDGNSAGFLFDIGHLGVALDLSQREFDRDPAGTNEIKTTSRVRLYEALRDRPRADQVYSLGRQLYQPWPTGDFERLVVLMGRAKQGQIEPAETELYWRETYLVRPFPAGLAEIFDDRDAVASYLRGGVAQSASNPIIQLYIAAHAAYIGEPELALEALQNSLSYFAVNITIVWTPLFREVRQLEEFRDYMREIGMVDVWLELGWPDFCQTLDSGGTDFRCD